MIRLALLGGCFNGVVGKLLLVISAFVVVLLCSQTQSFLESLISDRNSFIDLVLTSVLISHCNHESLDIFTRDNHSHRPR